MSAKLTYIEKEIQKRFRTFGGGQYTEGNPIAIALADGELQFAAGVSVKEVIATILELSNHGALVDACKYCRDFLGSGVGQSTHALAMIEAILAKIEKEESQ